MVKKCLRNSDATSIPELTKRASARHTKGELKFVLSDGFAFKVDRVIMVSYESYVLTQLIEHGPYLYEWTPFELVSLLSQAAVSSYYSPY